VLVSWPAVAGATSYEVYRRQAGTGFQLVATPTITSTNNTVAANTAALYRVRAVNGNGSSADSAADLSTAVIFTDPLLGIGVTPVKAAHFAQLRTAAVAVHNLTGLLTAPFTDPFLSNAIPIRRVHLIELRSMIDTARTNFGLAAVSYTDPTITQFVTQVKAAHVVDLREAVK
jgi:hypothetical protein